MTSGSITLLGFAFGSEDACARAEKLPAMDDSPLTFARFQDFIRSRYGERDEARGTAANFMWMMEEIGELATALHRASGFDGPSRRGEDLAQEFADVLGWLTTLANQHGVDLEAALRRKYLDHGGALHK